MIPEIRLIRKYQDQEEVVRSLFYVDRAQRRIIQKRWEADVKRLNHSVYDYEISIIPKQ